MVVTPILYHAGISLSLILLILYIQLLLNSWDESILKPTTTNCLTWAYTYRSAPPPIYYLQHDHCCCLSSFSNPTWNPWRSWILMQCLKYTQRVMLQSRMSQWTSLFFPYSILSFLLLSEGNLVLLSSNPVPFYFSPCPLSYVSIFISFHYSTLLFHSPYKGCVSPIPFHF